MSLSVSVSFWKSKKNGLTIVFSKSDFEGGGGYLFASKNSEKAKHLRMCQSIGGNVGETWLRQGPIVTRPYIYANVWYFIYLQCIYVCKNISYLTCNWCCCFSSDKFLWGSFPICVVTITVFKDFINMLFSAFYSILAEFSLILLAYPDLILMFYSFSWFHLSIAILFFVLLQP